MSRKNINTYYYGLQFYLTEYTDEYTSISPSRERGKINSAPVGAGLAPALYDEGSRANAKGWPYISTAGRREFLRSF